MIHFKRSISVLVLLITPLFAQAQIQENVLVRGANFNPEVQSLEMPDLISTERFQGKYFKIVLGKGEEGISLTEPNLELRLKAATAYYHLNKARNFWVEVMKSDYVSELPPITIRLEITNKFSDLGHFQNESIEPQYNNALSIPDGSPMDGVDIPAWGHEIWFRPKKTILSKDLPGSGLGPQGNPLSQYIKLLTGQVQSSIESQMIQTTLQKLFYPQMLSTTYQTAILKQIGTLALSSLILEGSKHTDQLFLEKYYYLDTAMVPEIIYHEFSHIALSDHLTLSLSTPILEGMADYFATAMSGRPEIASRIKLYSLSMPKNGRNKILYNPALEASVYSNSDFVLSVLWLIRDHFPELANHWTFIASTFLSTESSDIRHDLIGSLLTACDYVCEAPRLNKIELRQLLEEKGF
jgi:hypothetical protein